MKYSFENKVVIITGSTLGIGKALAFQCAELGAKIVLNGRSVERLEQTKKSIEKKGYPVIAVPADVTWYDQCQKVVKTALEKYNRIDVLINNAGLSTRGSFEESDPEVFKKVMDINFFGAVNMTKAAFPYLKESKGRIMFVSSVAGIRGLQNISAYCASKMALTSLVESLKIELHNTGVFAGITYVGMTQNEPGKRTMGPDGQLIPIEKREESKFHSPEFVARILIKNIRSKKYKSVLSRLGKMNYFFHKFFPGLVDRILIRANKKVMHLSK